VFGSRVELHGQRFELLDRVQPAGDHCFLRGTVASSVNVRRTLWGGGLYASGPGFEVGQLIGWKICIVEQPGFQPAVRDATALRMQIQELGDRIAWWEHQERFMKMRQVPAAETSPSTNLQAAGG
jgi:hypothetical protein